MGETPAEEWTIDEALVRALLADQFPQFADRPLTALANGWDNVIFRLGTDLTVRLPRRAVAVPLIEHEQRWLAELAPRLPLPTPAPLHHGRRSPKFDMPWSICPWMPGSPACDVPLTNPIREAERLGSFLTALHQPAPDEAPPNQFRGRDVRQQEPRLAANLARVAPVNRLSDDELLRRFSAFAGVDVYAGPPLWLHGDLHAANLLVDDGAISAIIDFGDLTSGDPAVDLAIGWMLFDSEAFAVFRDSIPDVDAATWLRGTAWALHFAIMYLAHSADDPRFERLGRRLLASVSTAPLP